MIKIPRRRAIKKMLLLGVIFLLSLNFVVAQTLRETLGYTKVRYTIFNEREIIENKEVIYKHKGISGDCLYYVYSTNSFSFFKDHQDEYRIISNRIDVDYTPSLLDKYVKNLKNVGFEIINICDKENWKKMAEAGGSLNENILDKQCQEQTIVNDSIIIMDRGNYTECSLKEEIPLNELTINKTGIREWTFKSPGFTRGLEGDYIGEVFTPDGTGIIVVSYMEYVEVLDKNYVRWKIPSSVEQPILKVVYTRPIGYYLDEFFALGWVQLIMALLSLIGMKEIVMFMKRKKK